MLESVHVRVRLHEKYARLERKECTVGCTVHADLTEPTEDLLTVHTQRLSSHV